MQDKPMQRIDTGRDPKMRALGREDLVRLAVRNTKEAEEARYELAVREWNKLVKKYQART